MTMIHIICFGNPLYGDDGAGQMVFSLLEDELDNKFEWASSVQLFYAGNSGQRAFPYFMNCSHLIIIDAIQGKKPSHPGHIYRLTAKELSQLDDESRNEISSHRLEVTQSWQLLKHCCDKVPRLTIFAIEGEDVTSFCESISNEVEQASYQVVLEIMQLCHREIDSLNREDVNGASIDNPNN